MPDLISTIHSRDNFHPQPLIPNIDLFYNQFDLKKDIQFKDHTDFFFPGEKNNLDVITGCGCTDCYSSFFSHVSDFFDYEYIIALAQQLGRLSRTIIIRSGHDENSFCRVEKSAFAILLVLRQG